MTYDDDDDDVVVVTGCVVLALEVYAWGFGVEACCIVNGATVLARGMSVSGERPVVFELQARSSDMWAREREGTRWYVGREEGKQGAIDALWAKTAAKAKGRGGENRTGGSPSAFLITGPKGCTVFYFSPPCVRVWSLWLWS